MTHSRRDFGAFALSLLAANNAMGQTEGYARAMAVSLAGGRLLTEQEVLGRFTTWQ